MLSIHILVILVLLRVQLTLRHHNSLLLPQTASDCVECALATELALALLTAVYVL